MTRQSSRILALSLSIVALLAADGRGKQREPESDFWAQVVDPGRRAFAGAMERGVDLLQKAKQVRTQPLLNRVLEDALAAFRSATRHSPNNYRGWLKMAEVLAELGRTKQTIVALKQARALDPPELVARFSVAFGLGIAYSKAGDFENAVLEYDRADQVLASSPSQRSDRAMLHGNAAEALMALGRLDEAIQRYRESLSYGSSALTRFGLAVAYDRDEQISKALEEMRLVLASDSTMRGLTRDSVFFIPEGDIHYYFALGYQCKGETEKAKSEWQLFLQKLPRSQWAPRARAHLAELGVAGQVQKARKTLAPVPRVSGGQEASSRDQDAVRRRMYGYLYRIRSCYSAELRKHPTLAGDLRLSFVVQPDGRADGIKVVRSTIKSASLLRCVTQTIKSIYFSRPVSARPVRVEYPLQFEP